MRAMLLVVTILTCRANATVSPASVQTSANQSGAPHRIVCVIPNVTAMLFAIGAGPQVVGVSSFSHDPAEVDKLTKVGGLLDPDTERILALKPDLVIVYAGQQALEQRLSRAGIRTVVYRHGTLRDVTATIRAMGTQTGHQASANRLADGIDRDVQTIASRVAGLPRPRTLLVLGHEPHAVRNVLASGGYGFLHDMLIAAGGADVFADVRRESVQASVEQILARAPEAIIELHYGSGNVEGLAPWKVLPSLPAVKTGRIDELTGEEFVEGGIHVAEATRRIARVLHPEAFK